MYTKDMAASLLEPPSFISSPPHHQNHKKIKYFPIKSQCFRDDGKSANNNVVDANLGVLRERISLVKLKERMERYNFVTKKKKGWEYQQFGYDPNLRKQAIASVSVEIMGLVTGALGFVFVSGSLCIYLVYLLVNINK